MMTRTRCGILFLALASLLIGTGSEARAQRMAMGGDAGSAVVRADTAVVYEGRALVDVLEDVERRTGIRVSYRDALVAGVRLTLSTREATMLDDLQRALRAKGLRLRVDAARGQAILTKAPDAAALPPQVLTGQVLDASSGARLPYATLLWTANGTQRGTASDEDGTFRIPLTGDVTGQETLALTVRYVGFATQTIRVDVQNPPGELSVRLRPKETQASGVVVQSRALLSNLDATWQTLMRPEQAAPLGESSVLQAVAPLPSVGLTPVLGDGLNVRGSREDGFHVVLDGMTIFNQNHLFGLFDAFNAEALQAVGFYYGVAPADYLAPPGGTLAFQTRTGAQTGTRVQAGASPVAVSATAEGPFGDGSGSWLVSARRSTLGMDWFGNETLVAQGLGTDRRTESPRGQADELEDRLFLPDAPQASFFDVHATGLWERPSGTRLKLSAYAGGDDAEQRGGRIRGDDDVTRRERFRRDFLDTTAVVTTNRWGNVGTSLQWHERVGTSVTSHLTAAVSRYYSRYSTDDFLYLGRPAEDASLQFFFGAFEQENELLEASLTHRWMGVLDGERPWAAGTWTLGYSARLYDVVYEERSAIFPGFRGTQESVLGDLFGQYDVRVGPAQVNAGLRTHYFSGSDDVRVSPRVDVQLFPDARVSVGAGYSRNHQFMHRLRLADDVSSAVWIPSTEQQPPGAVNHWMASVSSSPADRVDVRIEGYWKTHDNLRLHETVTRLQRGDAVILFEPWTARNTSTARGVETLLRVRGDAVEWTGSYTLSRVDVDPVGQAPEQPADWDRRHQGTTRLVWTPSSERLSGWSAHATWTLASGTPNPYAGRTRLEDDRLDAYHRLDLGVAYRRQTRDVHWSVRATLLNAYDRDNPWYRTAIGVTRPDGADPDRRDELGFALVDVYDVGLRPSVSVSVGF